MTCVEPAQAEAKGSRPFVAVTSDGQRLFIKALGSDQRDADLLYRAYRFARLRNVGDTWPAASVIRAVEHQALIGRAGKVLGVVSETDMLIKEAGRASHPEVFAGLRRSRDLQKAAGVTAAELMTSPPVTIGPEEPVQHAAFLMYDRAVERLPVVDEAGRLVGIVSQVDVLSIFAGQTRRSAAK